MRLGARRPGSDANMPSGGQPPWEHSCRMRCRRCAGGQKKNVACAAGPRAL